MNWALLILQYGIPFAEKVWQIATRSTPILQGDWDELKALASVTARQQLIAALTRAGVALDSPQAVALLSQVP